MTRTWVVRVSAGLLFVGAAWMAYTQNNQKQPPQLKINKVKDNLYEIEGDGGNVAALVTNEGVLLVDDKYDRDYEQIMSNLKTVTTQPVKYILSTHHHADHSGGNTKFEPATLVISTVNARRNIVEKKQAGAPDNMVPAQIAFTDQTSVFIGGIEARAMYVGRGHTNGDAVILFPQLRVLHTGDLMAGNTPLIDYPGGGSLAMWPSTLDAALKLDFDTVIPGHGPVTDKAGLKKYRDDVEREKARASELIKQGKSQEDVGKAMIAEFHWTANSMQMQWSLPGMMAELK